MTNEPIAQLSIDVAVLREQVSAMKESLDRIEATLTQNGISEKMTMAEMRIDALETARTWAFWILGGLIVGMLLAFLAPKVAQPNEIPSQMFAWHDKPGAKQLGVDNEIGAYLHKATDGGPLFVSMVIVCHTRADCPTQEQSAFLLFYRTREARDQGVSPHHPDYLGTGQFHVKEDGESLGKIIDFVFPDGTKWVRRSEAQEI